MAMTLRLSDADAALLREQAETEKVSQQEVITRAIRARVVARIAAEESQHYRSVLDRLAQ